MKLEKLTLLALAGLANTASAIDCGRPLALLTYTPATPATTLYWIDPAKPEDLGVALPITPVASNDQPTCLQVDTATGTLYAMTQLGNLATVDRTSGAVTIVGATGLAPSQPVYWLAFDPVTRDLLCVDIDGGQRVLDKATGAVLSTRTNLGFKAGDVLAGQTFWPANFVYLNDHPGAASTSAYVLEKYNFVLGNVSQLDLSSVTTTGYTNLATANYVAAAEMPDGMLYATANQTPYVPANKFYRIDPATVHTTYVGTLPLAAGTYAIDLCYDFDPNAADHDCDGYPSRIEESVEASIYSSVDTPFPADDEAPAPSISANLVKKIRVDLDFANPVNDRLLLKGKIELGIPDGPIDLEGRVIIVDLDGGPIPFVLDAKGRGADGAGAKIKVATKVKFGALTYAVKAKQVDLQAELADAGLTDQTVTDMAAMLEIELWTDALHVTQGTAVTYDAVAGVGGVAK